MLVPPSGMELGPHLAVKRPSYKPLTSKEFPKNNLQPFNLYLKEEKVGFRIQGPVQVARPYAAKAGDLGLIPGQGSRSWTNCN